MNQPLPSGMGPGPSQSPHPYPGPLPPGSPRQYSPQAIPPALSFGNVPFPHNGIPPMPAYYAYPGSYHMQGSSHQPMNSMPYSMPAQYYPPPRLHYPFQPPQHHNYTMSPGPQYDQPRGSEYPRTNGGPHRGPPSRNYARNHHVPQHFNQNAPHYQKRSSPATLTIPSSPFPLQTSTPTPSESSQPPIPSSAPPSEALSEEPDPSPKSPREEGGPLTPPSSPPVVISSIPAQAPSSVSSTTLRDAHYTISGSRPEDPSTAHGLIISHRAKPPPDVVKFAFLVEDEEPSCPVVVEKSGLHDTRSATTATPVNAVPVDAEFNRKGSPVIAVAAELPVNKDSVSSDVLDVVPVTPSRSSVYSSIAPTPTSHTPSPSSPISTATSISVQPSVAKASSPVSPPILVAAKPKPKSWADLVKPKDPPKPNPGNASDQTISAALAHPELAQIAGASTTIPSITKSSLGLVDPNTQNQQNGDALSPTPPVDHQQLLPPLHVILTTSPSFTPPAPLTHPRGLINSGNLCFANVVLQALLHSGPFYKLFEQVGRAVPAELGRRALIDATVVFLREFQLAANVPAPQPSSSSGTSTPMTAEQLKQLSWQQDPFIPQFLYDAMSENKRFDSMKGGRQEDAEEFLGFFLDTLHEELLAVLNRLQANPTPASAAWASSNTVSAKIASSVSRSDEREVERPVSPTGEEDGDGWLEVGKKNKITLTRATKARESAITRIFGGKLRSVLRTPGAGKDSVTLEPYQPLQLDIQPDHVRSIEDAFRHLTEPETVQVIARGGAVDATKQVFIETVPPILVVHIKRFHYDGHGVQKNSKVLLYKTLLEIPNDVLSPAQRSARPPRYRLYGVIYHHGKSATGGHYTVDLLRQDHSEWIRVDDTQIEAISESDVSVVSPDKGLDKDKVAYLLFYQRIADDRPVPSISASSVPTSPPSRSRNIKGATTSQKQSKGLKML